MQRFFRPSTSSRVAAAASHLSSSSSRPRLFSTSLLRPSAVPSSSSAFAHPSSVLSPSCFSRRAFSMSGPRRATIEPSTPVLDDNGAPALSHIRTLAVIAHVDHVRSSRALLSSG